MGSNDLSCEFVSQIPCFEVIEKIGIRKKFFKGDFLVTQGEELKFIPIVLKGVVRLDVATQNKDVLLDYLVAGESCAVSYSHFDIGQKLMFSGLALTEVHVLLIPISSLNGIFSTNVEFTKYLMNSVSRHLFSALEAVVGVHANDLERRLLNYLANYKEKLERNGLKVTHKMMADDLCVSREAITRTMAKLSRL